MKPSTHSPDAPQNSTIRLVDLQAQYSDIHAEVNAAMATVLNSAAFIMGPPVAQFEKSFAAFCDAPHCVGVGSGTAALDLALRAVGIGPGAEVITVSHTFIATAEAISAVGATPVFVEIDPVTYCMDTAALTAAITPQTRAVIPVHIYGHPANMPEICRIAEAHGLAVIEDAAQAHGATWEGRPLGRLANAACYSFYPGKNLGAYGDAGAVVTHDGELAERVRLLRNHGRRAKYEHEIIGFGERLDTLQAAVLDVKLGYLAEWTRARRALAATYSRALSQLPLVLPAVAPHIESAWHLYVVLTPERDALADFLRAQGIETGVHYPIPLHLQPAYAGLGYRRGQLPVTERVADTCLSLPLYPEMQPGQQQRVIDAMHAYFAERAGDSAVETPVAGGAP